MAVRPVSPAVDQTRSSPRSWLVLVLFLILVVGGGLLIGSQTTPGDWYAKLEKPWFNPPNWIFGPVWTVLYVLIAVTGWRVWTRRREMGSGVPAAIWSLQLVTNFFWSPVFFSAHQIGIALAIICFLLVCIVAFIAATLRRDALSAALFVPYLLWVSFATLLNAAILMLNGAA